MNNLVNKLMNYLINHHVNYLVNSLPILTSSVSGTGLKVEV